MRSIQRQADQARDRTSILRAEWALLNLPDRLRDVSGRHLALVRVEPAQYAALADFGRRLPMGDAPVQVAAVTRTVAPEVEPARDIVRDSPRSVRPAVTTVSAVAAPAVTTAAVRIAPAQPAPIQPAVVTQSARRVVVEPAAARPAAVRDVRPAAQPVITNASVTRDLPAPRAAQSSLVSPSASVLGGSRSTLAPPVPMASR